MREDDALIISLPVSIKSHLEKSGQRVVEVEASCEQVDLEGDLIEQKALLDSALTFVKTGHLDIDHISEIGHRLGIPNPDSYIVGRPLEVKDIGDKRTSVVGEIRRSLDGSHEPMKNRYDAFWDTLHSSPPVQWRASIYGFPPSDAVEDCTGKVCASGAKRYHIRAIDWRSLAFTRNPINDKIKGFAKVVSAKALIGALLKGGDPSLPAAMYMNLTSPPDIAPFNTTDGGGSIPYEPVNQGAGAAVAEGPLKMPMSHEGPQMPAFPMPSPRNMDDAVGQWHGHMKKDCVHCAGMNTTPGFSAHFQNCCGMPPHVADLFAHALMHRLLLDRRRR